MLSLFRITLLLDLLQFFEFLESSPGLLQRFLFLAEAESKLLLAIFGIAVEAASRDRSDANFLNQVLSEINIIRETEIADVGHNVIGSQRFIAMKSRLRQNP